MALDLNVISANYLEQTNNGGNQIGNQGGVSISYTNDVLLFTENDGDTFKVDAKNMTTDELNQLAEELNATLTVDKAEETKKSAKEGTLEANKAKLAEMEGEWNDLREVSNIIKKTVEDLSEDIKKNLDKTVKEQKKLTQEEQERVKELVATQIEQFKQDKENGKNVSLSSLEAKIADGMTNSGFDSAMASLMSNLIVTDAKMTEMDSLLTELGVVNGQMRQLDSEMGTLSKTIEKQEKEAEEAAKKSCDPIGFENNGTKFEFVIDKDNNGALSNFAEFLGSQDNFAEMIALDADNSGDVSKDELLNAGVKVLVTDANGNQTMKTLDEAFDDKDVNVNVKDFKEAQKGATASNGQELLGNFNISIGNDTFEGYSTLDSEDYLLNNYNFTDANPVNAGKTVNAGTKDAAEVNERTMFSDDTDLFIEQYTAQLKEFEADFESLTEMLGLDKEIIDSARELGKMTGTNEAERIIADAEAKVKEEKEAEEAKKAEEEKEAKEKEEEKAKEEEKMAA